MGSGRRKQLAQTKVVSELGGGGGGGTERLLCGVYKYLYTFVCMYIHTNTCWCHQDDATRVCVCSVCTQRGRGTETRYCLCARLVWLVWFSC